MILAVFTACVFYAQNQVFFFFFYPYHRNNFRFSVTKKPIIVPPVVSAVAGVEFGDEKVSYSGDIYYGPRVTFRPDRFKSLRRDCITNFSRFQYEIIGRVRG